MARTEVFAHVAARRLEASRVGMRVAVSAADFYHPAHLAGQVSRSIGHADIVVIDVGAFFVASGVQALDLSRLPRWATAVNDRIRHLRTVTHDLLRAYPPGERLVHVVETHARALAPRVLRPLIRRYPRPSIQEYELVLREAVQRIRVAGLRLVLQGPGGFNPDEPSASYSPETPSIYDEINAMAKRVAEAAALPIVDRIHIGHGHRALFLTGTSRYSQVGHHVMGEALAEHLLTNGLV